MQNEGKWRKYCGIYARSVAKVCFCIASPLFLLFFIASLFADTLSYDTYISFIPFIIAALIPGVAWLRGYAGKKEIALQEKMLGVSFSDNNAERLYKKGTNWFLSDDWVICCGRTALHRGFIDSVNIFSKKDGRYYQHTLKIMCIDGKTRCFRSTRAAEFRKIQKWFQEKT